MEKPATEISPVKKAKLKKYKGAWQAIGKRKTAIARVRMSKTGKEKGIIINDLPLNKYFKYEIRQNIVTAALEALNLKNQFFISVKVLGGGRISQAEAIRHGISRILVGTDEAYRKPLKALGFLTRDPRVKERKKPGLKRARRAPQWAKR